MSRYAPALKRLFDIEGGYSNHEHDPGGETAYGISKVHWPRYWKDGPPDRETAKKFYRREFWDYLSLGRIHDQRIAYEIFEQAVNLGRRRAVYLLQFAVNLVQPQEHQKLALDGVIGPKTRYAVNRLTWADSQRLGTVLNGLQFMLYLYRANYMDRALELFDTLPDDDMRTFFRGLIRRVEFESEDLVDG